jgi:hypothetical protein
MKKWVITWDIGYGPNAAVVEADTQEDAEAIAYEHAREDFKSNADWQAHPYSEELAEDLGAE